MQREMVYSMMWSNTWKEHTLNIQLERKSKGEIWERKSYITLHHIHQKSVSKPPNTRLLSLTISLTPYIFSLNVSSMLQESIDTFHWPSQSSIVKWCLRKGEGSKKVYPSYNRFFIRSLSSKLSISPYSIFLSISQNSPPPLLRMPSPSPRSFSVSSPLTSNHCHHRSSKQME